MKSASRVMQFMTCSFLPVVLFAACGGDGSTGVGPGPTPGIHAVLGADATDTIDTQLKQALVIEVRSPDGHVAPGVVVRFEAQPSTVPGRRYEAVIGVCALTNANCSGFSSFVADTTDAQGRASALIHLGTIPGKAVVKLSAPVLGLLDSVSYTVMAGAPANVRAVTADTGVIFGGTITLTGQVTDRLGNPRSEVTTTSLATGSLLTLDAAKNVVAGTAMGTQWVYAKYGSFVDSTSVRVFPPGRLVVWDAGPREIRLVNTDGSNIVTLARNVSSDLGAFPHFDPSRQHVTFHAGTADYGGAATNISVVDTSTLARQDLNELGFTNIVAERQMSDGSLLVVGERGLGTGYSLWKVGIDNTITAGAGLPAMQRVYDSADISRDGSKVAYVAWTGTESELRVVDATSGNFTVLATRALSPRFSPQADRVAFFPTNQYSSSDGTVAVIDVSGANRKLFGSFVLSPGLAWSPDGVYLLGRDGGAPGGIALLLLRVSDGANVLLRFHRLSLVEDYFQPDWR